jgi:hypothetical protein
MIEIQLYRSSRGFLMKSTFVIMTFILWLVWVAKIIWIEGAIEVLR